MNSEVSKEIEALYAAIKILCDLGEKELAFQLRVLCDTHYREWRDAR
mgnify:CR=1 FL=1